MTPVRNSRGNDTGHNDDLISQDGDDEQNGAILSSLSNKDVPAKPVYTSQLATLFILLNVTVGTGLLAMPFALQEAGIVASMMIQSIFLILSVVTCLICIELTIKSGVNSYHELIQKYCHQNIYRMTQVTIFLLTFAVTVAYIVVIGDQTDRVFASSFGPTFCKTWYMHRRFVMTISTAFIILPLCSAKTIDFLKYASFLGLVTIGSIFYVVADDFSKISKISPDVNYYPKSWSDITSILPIFSLGYHCHLSLVPTIASIDKKEKRRAFVTVTISMILAMIVYTGISVMAILTFGSSIQKDLTENFEGRGSTTLFTIVMVAVKCALTLPAAYLPARLSLVDALNKSSPKFANFSEPAQRIGVTLVFLFAALLVAVIAPNILVVINLVGCATVVFVFSLPGMAYINLVKQNRRQKQQESGLEPDESLTFTAKDQMKLWASYFFIVFGIVITGIVLYKSIADMTAATPSSPLCHD